MKAQFSISIHLQYSIQLENYIIRYIEKAFSSNKVGNFLYASLQASIIKFHLYDKIF